MAAACDEASLKSESAEMMEKLSAAALVDIASAEVEDGKAAWVDIASVEVEDGKAGVLSGAEIKASSPPSLLPASSTSRSSPMAAEVDEAAMEVAAAVEVATPSIYSWAMQVRKLIED